MSDPINLNAMQEQVDAAVARANEDPALAQGLRTDPAAALRAQGVTIPAGVELVVHPQDGNVPHVSVQVSRA